MTVSDMLSLEVLEALESGDTERLREAWEDWDMWQSLSGECATASEELNMERSVSPFSETVQVWLSKH